MKKYKLARKILAVALVGVFSQSSIAFEQSRSIDCIAPAAPGGGWDFTCRSIGKVMSDLDIISGTVQTNNMPGAGGGVAFAHVVGKRKKDSSLMVASSTSTTTRLAQRQFPGMDPEGVRWAGAVGADFGVIAVGNSSPYNTLNELIDAIKKDPKQVKFAGGSAAGGWDHLKVLIAAKSGGVTDLKHIPYLAFAGGAEALTQVVGGHISAFTGDVSEIIGFLDSGDVRVLAVLSDERLPAPLNDLPTAKEQNIEAVAPNWRGFYVPKNISDEAYQWWVQSLDQIYVSEQWQAVMRQSGLMPFHKTGAEFKTFVDQQVQDIRAISKDVGLIR
ncbi:Bug family tripartite tricarboxylate transporter substrate binding protein [Sessilibacter corallicola]|uniref:Bug family tripartite tricarboxylate transporter substrate binding protein n=1 Tax=Sessilibacter corallicola TaxID=2904075 RepID=UPI001E60E5F9|nr:tripartite tricarboxylate transporter substrate-binding protein [Sessilibacter corallicola]MCE2030139.1 hypothetical protein [Sessilibacter corallicola]